MFFQTLLQKEFDLIVNETSYRVQPSEQVTATTGLVGLSPDEMTRFGDVRALVGQLYEVRHCLSNRQDNQKFIMSVCLSVCLSVLYVCLSPDEMTRFGDVRALVGQLYEVRQ